MTRTFTISVKKFNLKKRIISIIKTNGALDKLGIKKNFKWVNLQQKIEY